MLDRDRAKKRFTNDTENHTMEVLMDTDLYRHLKFTNNGSQCYRFDIHTWPGHLCVSGDMGTYVFSRLPDMFEFFRMNDNDFNKKYVINPGYWSEKLEAVNSSSARSNDSNGYEEFSEKEFKDAVKQEYDSFCEAYADDDEEEVTEAYPEGTQTRKQQLEQLWEELDDEVIGAACDGQIRGYDAAMSFRWDSDDDELHFDMCDFWDHNCTEYTFHFIWICYAIAWGIGQYDDTKEAEFQETYSEPLASD